MEFSIASLVSEVKNEILWDDKVEVDTFVSPSAYDTAWLAMIPHQHNQDAPMFHSSLNWILRNQKEAGFWGETEDEQDLPALDALPATLACLVALKLWNVGHHNIESGVRFIHSNAEILMKTNYQNLPRWFVLSFPAMIELAEAVGLHLVFPQGLISLIAHIFITRHHIIHTEELVLEGEEWRYLPPLLSYLETLPSTYQFDRDPQQTINRHLSRDGSLFQSPSATAQAFMSTGNIHSLKYLHSLLRKFPNGGVPAMYPVDGDLIKLCMVDHVQGLGLAAHFNQEIQQLIAQVYRNQKNHEKSTNSTVPVRLFKDALAFRLLRMHGHNVHPRSFCWFLHEPETVSYMEENCQHFITAMYSVYRATDLSFPGETEMDEAREFATKFLQNPNTRHRDDHNFLITKGLQNMMKYELDVPWTARLDRLYHRKWIEENKISPLWIGKASFYRLSCLDNKKLMQLAVENFEFQQSVYRQELEELKGWSKKWRLSEMGFGREKTVYTYFAVASCSFLPYNSMMRLVIAKAAIIVTVADDFYDMEGSLSDLEILTHAVMRWDGEGLEGHSKTIFEALDDFVNHIVAICHPHPQQGSDDDVVSNLKHLWRESFTAWMVERRWSETGHLPSMDEYLEIGMSSIAVHTIALPATTFLNQTGSSLHGYQNITKLLMAVARLANDLQSYEKEVGDGKMNMVLLHWLQQHPNGGIGESVAQVEQMLEMKRKELMQHVMVSEEMPESCKQIHLQCMKVFEMFFNSGNLFDSETALLDDINKSIYLPICGSNPKAEQQQHHLLNMNKNQRSKAVSACFKPPRTTNLINNFSVAHSTNLLLPIRFNPRFMALPL